MSEAESLDEPYDAVTQAGRLDEIPFASFTSKLVSDTFDAIVSSMIRQQESYAELLEAVSQSIEQFETQNVSNGEVNQWLASNFPKPNGGTGSSIGTPSQPGSLSEGDAVRLDVLLGDTASDMGVTLPGDGDLDEQAVANIRSVVRRTIANPRLEALRELVSQGIVRLVVDDGFIETDLDFHVEDDAFQGETGSTYNRETDSYGGDAGWLGGLFGINAEADHHEVNVTTKDTTDLRGSSSEIDIKGHVKINVRGDYQPLRPPEPVVERTEEPEPVIE